MSPLNSNSAHTHARCSIVSTRYPDLVVITLIPTLNWEYRDPGEMVEGKCLEVGVRPTQLYSHHFHSYHVHSSLKSQSYLFINQFRVPHSTTPPTHPHVVTCLRIRCLQVGEHLTHIQTRCLYPISTTPSPYSN